MSVLNRTITLSKVASTVPLDTPFVIDDNNIRIDWGWRYGIMLKHNLSSREIAIVANMLHSFPFHEDTTYFWGAADHHDIELAEDYIEEIKKHAEFVNKCADYLYYNPVDVVKLEVEVRP